MEIKFRTQLTEQAFAELTKQLNQTPGAEIIEKVFSPEEAIRIQEVLTPPKKDNFVFSKNRKIELSPDEYTIETGTIPGQTPLEGEVSGIVPKEASIKKLREDINKNVKASRQTPIEARSYTVESKPIVDSEK